MGIKLSGRAKNNIVSMSMLVGGCLSISAAFQDPLTNTESVQLAACSMKVEVNGEQIRPKIVVIDGVRQDVESYRCEVLNGRSGDSDRKTNLLVLSLWSLVVAVSFKARNAEVHVGQSIGF